jgi:hypothetical protein
MSFVLFVSGFSVSDRDVVNHKVQCEPVVESTVPRRVPLQTANQAETELQWALLKCRV